MPTGHARSYAQRYADWYRKHGRAMTLAEARASLAAANHSGLSSAYVIFTLENARFAQRLTNPETERRQKKARRAD